MMTTTPTADQVFEQIRSNIQGNGTAPGPDGVEYHAGDDLEPRSTCSKCGELRPISEFSYRSGPKAQEKIRSVCRQCRNKQQADRRAAMVAGTWVPNAQQARQTTAREERLAQVRELFDQNLSYAEIGKRIGVKDTTVQDYVRTLGLSRRNAEPGTARQSNVQVVDNITRQLSDLVMLVHDGRHVAMNLDGVHIDPETRKLWNKRLAHVGKAMRYIRGYTKGETTE